MNYILLISLIAAALSAVFSLTRQLQMLQQNSYFPSRYFNWLKGSYTIPLTLCCFIACISALLYSRSLYAVQLVLILLLLAARIILCIRQQKKSIKKLVFTARVKRLYAASALVFAAFILLYAFLSDSLLREIFAVLSLFLSFITPLTALIAWIITLPIEKCAARYYINDAKRILKEHKNLTVIGITGSYGKTTVKFILERILSEKYNVVATPQSFNTPMGVVRTVREKLKPQTQIFLCEMGAKNIGDIKEICDIVHPTYGIITSVGPQHLETFKTVDNVFKTKFELADEVIKNGGKVFVNGDSAELLKRIDKSLYTVYGENPDFDFYTEDISYGKNGSQFTFSHGETKISLSSKLLGKHSINDISGAAAVAYSIGVDSAKLKYAVSQLKPVEHRLELKSFMNGSALIDDAYNANPEGSLEAVRVLASFDGMKKVIVTPGLIELGAREYDCNFALGVEAAKFCDIIILVGTNRSKPIRDGVESAGFNKEKLYTVSSFKEAMTVFSGIADKNTAVLFENDLPDNYLY